MELACTACCTARLQSVWTSFALRPLKLNWKHPGIGLGVFYSVSRMECFHVDRFFIGLQSHACSANRSGSESMEEAGSGHEDSSHNILTLIPCRFV
jgi:hypothetical protein